MARIRLGAALLTSATATLPQLLAAVLALLVAGTPFLLMGISLGYLLPVKAAVRKAEGLVEGDEGVDGGGRVGRELERALVRGDRAVLIVEHVAVFPVVEVYETGAVRLVVDRRVAVSLGAALRGTLARQTPWKPSQPAM